MSQLLHKGLEVLQFGEQNEFYQWLAQNHRLKEAVWVRFFKKGSGVKSVTHGEAVDMALCWGWIDGLLNKLDEKSYVIRFTPRRKKSVWSKINVEKVVKLIENGMMQEAGLAHVEAAKADGRWEKAYVGQSQMEIPADFIELLELDQLATDIYKKIPRNGRYAIYYRLHGLTDPSKREAKIKNLIQKIKQNPGSFGVK